MTEVPDRKAAWRNAFADTSGAIFKTVVAPNVTLTGSVFATAVVGADAVWDMLRTTASIYDDLQFTESLDTSNRSYLEWEGHAVTRSPASPFSWPTKRTELRTSAFITDRFPLSAPSLPS
jgi:hypothetical protein